MTTITATELKTKTGQVLDRAKKEPVVVQSHGRNTAVLLDYEEYELLRRMEDAYWTERALEGERSGFLGAEETERLIKEKLASMGE